MLPDVVSFLDFSVFGLAPHIPARRSVLSMVTGWQWDEGHRFGPLNLSHEDCYDRPGWILGVETREIPGGSRQQRDALMDDQAVSKLRLSTSLRDLPEEPPLRRRRFQEVVGSVLHPSDVPSENMVIAVDEERISFKVFTMETTWTAWGVARERQICLIGYDMRPEEVALSAVRDLQGYPASSRPFTRS